MSACCCSKRFAVACSSASSATTPRATYALYFVDQDKVIANLRHAREAGATEVVLLDPTLNQRKDFDDFLRLAGSRES